MDDELYDEFGNYIGPELSDEEDDDVDAVHIEDVTAENEELHDAYPDAHAPAVPEEMSQAVVLHEDKQYYPDAEEVYGPGVETLVQDEDTQGLEEAVLAKKKDVKFHSVLTTELPETTFTIDYLTSLSELPDRVRNVAICGALHHGKTLLADLLVKETHPEYKDVEQWKAKVKRKRYDEEVRFTDSRGDERARQISLKSAPLSLVLPSLGTEKSYVCNVFDTPGHTEFFDEVSAALRLADGMILTVDVVEGVLAHTKNIIKHAVQERVPIVAVALTKIDRLITDLRIPASDAYHKMRLILEEVNNTVDLFDVADASGNRLNAPSFSPDLGNVLFVCAAHQYCFSLPSFAYAYLSGGRTKSSSSGDSENRSGGGMVAQALAFSRKLWGNVYFDVETRKFLPLSTKKGGKVRSFLTFILEPLYKLYSHVLAGDRKAIDGVLSSLSTQLRLPKLHLTQSDYDLDIRPLLKRVCMGVFGPLTAQSFAYAVVERGPSPVDGARRKLEATYTGVLEDSTTEERDAVEAMHQCSNTGPMVIQVAKLYHKENDPSRFDAFGRVMSGTIRVGQRVRVLNPSYSPDDPEESSIAEVAALYIYQTKYRVAVDRAQAGQWILIEGLDDAVTGPCTLCPVGLTDLYPFKELRCPNAPCVRVSVEPLLPAELPKIVEGLRSLHKSYPSALTRVEENGEHVLIGSGELSLDCMLHDLRHLYAADVEVKISDPMCTLRETVVETSSIPCHGRSPNQMNKLVMIAEPMANGLAEDIENGQLCVIPNAMSTLPGIRGWQQSEVDSHRSGVLQSKYGWDVLSSRSVWSFGPDVQGPNVLMDYTVPGEVDAGALKHVKDFITQGFQWGCREGPLCDEPMRNLNFKLLGAELADQPILRSGGQIIPTARRVAYSSFLLASPRLMEPIYSVEVLTPPDCVNAVFDVFNRRRGHVLQDMPMPGTPLYQIRGLVPVLESFGFETDIRVSTHGLAYPSMVFDSWSVVPGDPLDESIVLHPLTPAPTNALARDMMLKTRRRKGMSEEVSINKFFDESMLLELAKMESGQ